MIADNIEIARQAKAVVGSPALLATPWPPMLVRPERAPDTKAFTRWMPTLPAWRGSALGAGAEDGAGRGKVWDRLARVGRNVDVSPSRSARMTLSLP